MTLQLGLVGLPNVGKSTLFNALTKAGALVASYPFTTIEPNVGVVPVPDERLDALAALIQPERVVPATLRVVDIAGLVKGASQGEGLGNQFLSHIRGVDAIAMVVRCFEDESVPHVTPYLDPVEDIDIVRLELALADLDIVERHLERLRSRAKANPREFEDLLEATERIASTLRTGQPLRSLLDDEHIREALAAMDLLTVKPLIYVANVSEDMLPQGGPLADRVREHAAKEGVEVITLSAQLEDELTALSPEEAAEYLASVGVETSGLERFVRAGYRLLDYITFFTVTGGNEARAWTLRCGQTVYEAAGQIHSDMQRGFIRAEVINWQQLVEIGSLTKARELGRVAIEGRDYLVRDGDVIHIRFAV